MTTEHETPLIRAVDDDEDQLISLEALLSGEGWDVAAYTSARDFFVNDRPSRPGCLILDLRMPDVSGLEVQAEMKKRGITLPIIFLTGHGDIDTAVFAIRAGAEEFLQKPVQPDRLLTTVARSVQKDCDSREHPIDEAEWESRFGRLTTREREIIRLAAKGLLNRQIAAKLAISERTVQVHRLSAYRKLDVHNTAELAPVTVLLERGKLGGDDGWEPPAG